MWVHACAEVIILQLLRSLSAGCIMTITESMPGRAFNLLAKCNESGQKCGHLNLIKKGGEICKWFIISCGDSSVTHVKMMLSWKLKGIFPRHYFPNIDGKWERENNLAWTMEQNSFYLVQFSAYYILFALFYPDLFLKSKCVLSGATPNI